MRRIALAITVLTILPLSALAQQGIYRWVDSDGQIHYGDSVPPEYADEPKQLVDEHAIPRREIAGKKTAEQIAAEKAAEEAALMRELKRRADQTLIVTYQNVKEIEMHRERRLELFKAQARVTELYLTNQRRQLNKMYNGRKRYKPYSSDPDAPMVPPKLVDDIKEAEELIDRHEQNLKDYQQEEETIRKRFDGDIRRFKELKGLPEDDDVTTMTASQAAVQSVPE